VPGDANLAWMRGWIDMALAGDAKKKRYLEGIIRSKRAGDRYQEAGRFFTRRKASGTTVSSDLR